MAVSDLHGLFEHELKDMYYAEHKLVEALGQLAEESAHKDIKQAFTKHQRVTEGHVKRLERVFKLFGEPPEPVTCQGIEGLLKEQKTFLKEKPSPDILDLYNLGAGEKVERYEMTAYENLIMLAQKLELPKAVELLQQNMQEEQEAYDKLHSLGQSYNMESLMGERLEAERGSKAAQKASS